MIKGDNVILFDNKAIKLFNPFIKFNYIVFNTEIYLKVKSNKSKCLMVRLNFYL